MGETAHATRLDAQAEELRGGEVVELAYDADSEAGVRTEVGVVCKSNKGGIRVLVSQPSVTTGTLRVVQTTGLVLTTSGDGGRRSQIGRGACVAPTGNSAPSVAYRDNAYGWEVTDPDEAEEVFGE